MGSGEGSSCKCSVMLITLSRRLNLPGYFLHCSMLRDTSCYSYLRKVWAYRCLSISLFEHIFVWAYLCLSISLFEHIFVWASLFEHIFVWAYLCLNISLFEHIFVWAYLCLSISLFEHIFVWAYLCLSISLFEHIFVWAYLCLSISLFDTSEGMFFNISLIMFWTFWSTLRTS